MTAPVPYGYYDDRPEPDDEDFDSDCFMPIPFAAATPSLGKNPTRVALRDWPDDDDDDCQLLEVYERPPLAMDGRGKTLAAKSGKWREASYCGAQPSKKQRAAAAVAPETKPLQPRKIRKISQCVPRDPVVSGYTM